MLVCVAAAELLRLQMAEFLGADGVIFLELNDLQDSITEWRVQPCSDRVRSFRVYWRVRHRRHRCCFLCSDRRRTSHVMSIHSMLRIELNFCTTGWCRYQRTPPSGYVQLYATPRKSDTNILCISYQDKTGIFYCFNFAFKTLNVEC